MQNTRKLIVALDVNERSRAIELARLLRDEVAMVKVGLEGFVAHGPDLVRDLRAEGVEVFLDLKVHDIPRTAGAAARQAAALQARLFTVHAAGGPEMIRAVRDEMPPSTRVIAVTVLTSLDTGVLAQMGFAGDASATAHQLGQLAVEHGADGLVCSAHELRPLSDLGGVRVVPGVRPQTRERDDQRRIATPRWAANEGATWVVVGRPIVMADDPLQSARSINQELAEAVSS